MARHPSRRDAADELLARRRARRDLLSFTQYTMPSFQVGEHHRIICDALGKLWRGEYTRLIIEAPPRHTKSELATRRFPAWGLGQDPSTQIISASYGAHLARDFGRKVRDIVSSHEYQRLFRGVGLRADAKAADHWLVTGGGEYTAAGVGGAITGRGCHVGIVDDVVKNAQEADSQVYRDRTWDWYQSTFRTRAMPGFRAVVILTRWHEDDLAGRLIEEQSKGGEYWHRVRLQAIAHEHTANETALWPAWYPLEELRRTRQAVGPRVWQALYQQEPTAEQGNYFRREWLHWYQPADRPKNLHLYGASDYAVTDGAGDYTEHGVLGLDHNGHVYVVDWWHGQTSSDVWIDSMLDLIAKHKPLAWFGEAGVIEKAVAPMLTMRQRERKVYFRAEWLASIHDKAIRARSFQALAASGRVWLPDTPMGHRLAEQLVRFPTGKHDDAVDVCSLFGRALDQTHPAIVSRQAEQPAKDRWREIAESKRRGSAESWRTV